MARSLNKNITLSSGVMAWVKCYYPKLKLKDRQAMVVVLENALCSSHTGVWYTRDTGGKMEPLRYNAYQLGDNIFKKVVDLLSRDGWITSVVGDAHVDKDKRSPSLFWCSEELRNVFPESEVDYIDEQDRLTYNTILLKDKNKDLVDFKDGKYVVTAGKQVARTNKFNDMFDYLHPVDGELCNSKIIRIYNDGRWDKGGRFYRTEVHSIKQRDEEGRKLSIEQTRLGLRIRRKGDTGGWSNVVELDYGAMHVMIVAAMNNMDLSKYSGDIYTDILPENYIEQDRVLFKKSVLIMLNARGKQKARKAIQQEIDNGYYSFRNASNVIERIEEHLPEFVDFFYRDDSFGLTLQHMDSEVMVGILKAFSDVGRPIVPVHDSVVVCAEDEKLAFDAMCRSFYNVMEPFTDDPCFTIVCNRWDGTRDSWKMGTLGKPLSTRIS